MRTALFPGTFDPFTIGHYDIVMRGLDLFDRVVIAIGHNYTKRELFSIQEREARIRACFAGDERVEVRVYDTLTIDFAREVGAAYILRGVRSVQDFEYERSMAEANRRLGGIETVLLYTRPEYAHISSTLVRDLHSYGKDITPYLPQSN